MKKIKIIHTAEDLKTGGYETLIAQIARYLDHQSFDLSIWCLTRAGDTAHQLQTEGFDVSILDYSSCYDPFALARFRKRVLSERPDIIHSHTYFSGVLCRLALWPWHEKIHFVSHFHSPQSGYGLRHFGIDQWLNHQTDKIICCSSAVKENLLKHEKIDHSKVCVLHNGIDTKHFLSFNLPLMHSRKMLDIPPQSPVLITVANLREEKNHETLLRSMVFLKKDFPDIRLLLVGDGPLRTRLERQCREWGLQNHVFFYGVQKDVRPFLAASDLFILPSHGEGLPLSVLEAMAMKRPVIASDIEPLRSIVMENTTGLRFRSSDHDDLTQKIITMLRDPVASRKMGENGRDLVMTRFDMNSYIKELEKIYRSITAGSMIHAE